MLLQVIINDNGTLLGVNKSSDEAAAFAQMITVGVCVCGRIILFTVCSDNEGL